MYELEVTGMSCSHCISSVKQSVLAVDAAAKVEIDLATQKVHVDSQTALVNISAAIADAGFPVTSSRVA